MNKSVDGFMFEELWFDREGVTVEKDYDQCRLILIKSEGMIFLL